VRLVENRDVMVLARFAHGNHTIIAILRFPLLALSVLAKISKQTGPDRPSRHAEGKPGHISDLPTS
jgi:hypothetical protein